LVALREQLVNVNKIEATNTNKILFDFIFYFAKDEYFFLFY